LERLVVDDEGAAGGSVFHGVLRALARRLWVIGLCVVVAGGAAYALSKSQTQKYSATAQLLLSQLPFESQLAGGLDTGSGQPQSSSPAAQGADPTQVKIASLPVVADRTAAVLGVSGGRVEADVSVSGDNNANFAYVKATDPDRRFAARLANAFAVQYIAFQKQAQQQAIAQARDVLAREQGAQGVDQQDLTSNLAKLRTLEALQTGNAQLIQRASVPGSPSSPKTARNTALGLGIGLLIGLLLAYVFELLDRRVKDPEEFEKLYKRPTLGAIPQSPALAKVNFHAPELKARDRDAFRMLRANLRYFNIDREVNSLMVTSAAGGEGKTTIAWNLAAAAAEAGARTLLLEADLRDPQLVKRFKVPADRGLSDILTGQAQPSQVIHQVMVTNRTNGHAPMPLDVITAGRHAPNPTDLLESEAMQKLIDEAERHYDLVIIDPPPTTIVSDAVPLIKRVSGVMVVCRLGTSKRDEAIHLNTHLHNLAAPLLGIVINDIANRRAYYSFGYGYAAPETKLPTPQQPEPAIH